VTAFWHILATRCEIFACAGLRHLLVFLVDAPENARNAFIIEHQKYKSFLGGPPDPPIFFTNHGEGKLGPAKLPKKD
jgi:hypothetical protein